MQNLKRDVVRDRHGKYAVFVVISGVVREKEETHQHANKSEKTASNQGQRGARESEA
jgi:hypothetical protein